MRFVPCTYYHTTAISRRRDGINYKLTTHATRLLMDQLVPASYLQLEDTVRKIAQHYHNQQKPPVLTAQEFRYISHNKGRTIYYCVKLKLIQLSILS